MTASKRSTTTRVKALVALRAELDDRVGNRADVIGSMVGLKFRAGQLTKQLGITYFVREKIAKAHLSPRRRVPVKLRVGEAVVTTDVVAWPHMAEQSLPPGTIVYDGRQQGTLSCFGLSQAGVFGVSCAHCLTGIDGNPATPSAIAIYANPSVRFVPVGATVYLAYSPGIGVPGNYGYLDCGLFDLRDHALAARAAAGKVLKLVNDIHTLVGYGLVGISPLNAPGSSGSLREAQAVGVEAQALGERSDLVLNVQVPGTFRGDSGMLWLTEDGRAAAVHARGEVLVGMQGSRLTTAMSARRVSASLGVRLVQG